MALRLCLEMCLTSITSLQVLKKPGVHMGLMQSSQSKVAEGLGLTTYLLKKTWDAAGLPEWQKAYTKPNVRPISSSLSGPGNEACNDPSAITGGPSEVPTPQPVPDLATSVMHPNDLT